MSDPIVISGLGPGGLAAAIEAARKGYPVIGLTNRKEYIRTQRVRLSQETVDYLQTLVEAENPEDCTFIQKILIEKSSAQIKDIERFLERKLRQFSNVKIYNATITQIDPVSHSLTLSDKQTLVFKHLIAADGAHHQTADLYNKATNDTANRINYQTLPIELRHDHHFVASFKSKYAVTGKTALVIDAEVARAGWDKTTLPGSYIVIDRHAKKIFIAGYLPNAIANLTPGSAKRSAIKKWAKVLITKQCTGITINDLTIAHSAKHGRKKDDLNLQSFTLQVARADKGIVQCGPDNFFMVLGDAFQSPMYQYAHGVNDAIATAKIFGCALNDPQDEDSLSLQSSILEEFYESLKHDLNKKMIILMKDPQARIATYLHTVIEQFTSAIKDIDQEVIDTNDAKQVPLLIDLKDELEKQIKFLQNKINHVDTLKLDDVKKCLEDSNTILDCFMQKFSENNASKIFTKKIILGIAIILTGVLPGLIGLAIRALHTYRTKGNAYIFESNTTEKNLEFFGKRTRVLSDEAEKLDSEVKPPRL